MRAEVVARDGVTEGIHFVDHLRSVGDEVRKHRHPTLHDGAVEESLGHGRQNM